MVATRAASIRPVVAANAGGESRDALTARWFNGQFTLRAPSSVDRAAVRLFNQALSPAAYGNLVGAPDGATVLVSPSPANDRLTIVVQHDLITAMRREVLLGAGGVLLWNALLVIKKPLAPAHLGLRILAHEVRAADRLGIPAIATHAAGGYGDAMNGYYTWPRYGFAASIPTALTRQLPPALAGASDVLDVMATPVGRAWWKRYGRSLPWAEFDTRPGSRSRRVLAAYLAANGIAIGDELRSQRPRLHGEAWIATRLPVIEAVVRGERTLQEAARELGRSERQTRRIIHGFVRSGQDPTRLAYHSHPAANTTPLGTRELLYQLREEHPDWSGDRIAEAATVQGNVVSRSAAYRWLRRDTQEPHVR